MTKLSAAATTRAIRTILLETCERVRITKNGEVHCYGIMPNTNITGWYFKGFIENLAEKYADRLASMS